MPWPKWCSASGGRLEARKANTATSAAPIFTVDSIASESRPTDPVTCHATSLSARTTNPWPATATRTSRGACRPSVQHLPQRRHGDRARHPRTQSSIGGHDHIGKTTRPVHHRVITGSEARTTRTRRSKATSGTALAAPSTTTSTRRAAPAYRASSPVVPRSAPGGSSSVR